MKNSIFWAPRPGTRLKRSSVRFSARGRAAEGAGNADQKLLFCSAKREVTDSPSEMRRIVSANRKATDSWRIFLQDLPASDSGSVFVMTTSSSAEFLMRSTAGPENTGCVQYA